MYVVCVCVCVCVYLLTTVYPLSHPQSDNIKDPHVLKLSHATKRHFFFQLPGDFEFHKWLSALQELCECDVNKYGFDD